MDTKGLGYYLDKRNPEAKLKGKMFGNMSWLSEDAELEVEAAKGKASEDAAAAAAAASAASSGAQSASPKAVTTLALPGAAPKALSFSIEARMELMKLEDEFAIIEEARKKLAQGGHPPIVDTLAKGLVQGRKPSPCYYSEINDGASNL